MQTSVASEGAEVGKAMACEETMLNNDNNLLRGNGEDHVASEPNNNEELDDTESDDDDRFSAVLSDADFDRDDLCGDFFDVLPERRLRIV